MAEKSIPERKRLQGLTVVVMAGVPAIPSVPSHITQPCGLAQSPPLQAVCVKRGLPLTCSF